MASYFDEHNCEPLQPGEEANHALDLARWLSDSGIGAQFRLEFARLYGRSDGRKQPPAAKHIIENLPSTNNFNPDEKCTICLKKYQLDSTKELPCHHKYCTNCIIQWLKLVNTCPMCRVELPTDDKEYEEYKTEQQRSKQRQLEVDDLHNSMFS